jgi:hypothetical protein
VGPFNPSVYCILQYFLGIPLIFTVNFLHDIAVNLYAIKTFSQQFHIRPYLAISTLCTVHGGGGGGGGPQEDGHRGKFFV